MKMNKNDFHDIPNLYPRQALTADGEIKITCVWSSHSDLGPESSSFVVIPSLACPQIVKTCSQSWHIFTGVVLHSKDRHLRCFLQNPRQAEPKLIHNLKSNQPWSAIQWHISVSLSHLLLVHVVQYIQHTETLPSGIVAYLRFPLYLHCVTFSVEVKSRSVAAQHHQININWGHTNSPTLNSLGFPAGRLTVHKVMTMNN